MIRLGWKSRTWALRSSPIRLLLRWLMGSATGDGGSQPSTEELPFPSSTARCCLKMWLPAGTISSQPSHHSYSTTSKVSPATEKKNFLVFAFFFFLGPHLQLMEVPRLGVELELQLPAYATVTAMQPPSCICNLHRTLWQCWILNPLSKARDRTRILTDIISGS